jgi:hypothetical protein
MSAMPAEKLREPEELWYVPQSFSEEDIEKILAALPEPLGPKFFGQMFHAIREAKEEGDLRPINLVLESWWRTLLFETRPKFDKLWDEDLDEEPLSLDDIRRRRAQRTR